MSDWEKIKLKDCCLSITDGDHQAPPKAESGVPFITISNIDGFNRLDFGNTMFVPQEYFDHLDEKRKPQSGDIIYSVVGSFGKPVLLKNDKPFTFQRHIALLRPDKSKADARFLYYTTLSHKFYMQADSIALGAAQRTISLTALKNMTVDLPPLPTQQRIAEMLGRYDDLIDNYRQQIRLLEEAAQRLYREWFVDFHFPGHEDTRFVDGVPEGWEKKTLGDVATINKQNLPKVYEGEEIHYVDIGSVREGSILEYTTYQVGQQPGRAKRIAQDGDIIWGMVRPNLKAYALVQHPSSQTVFSTGFAVITAETVCFPYLYCYLTTESFVGYLVNCTNGAAYPAVKPTHFENAEIIVPPINLTEMFRLKAEPLFRERYYLELQLRHLTEARDRLLPKLMSGEITIN